MVAPMAGGAAGAAPAAGAAGAAEASGARAAAGGAAGAGKRPKTPKPKAKGGGRVKSGRADEAGAPTKSDNAELKRQAAEGDAMMQNAYEAGLAGDTYETDDPQLRQAYETGVEERRGQAREDRRQQLGQGAQKALKAGGPDWVNDGAGFVLGLFVYALVLNYLQGGGGQVKGWIAAKFINKPYRRTARPQPSTPSNPSRPRSGG